jgi:hypothetical protein
MKKVFLLFTLLVCLTSFKAIQAQDTIYVIRPYYIKDSVNTLIKCKRGGMYDQRRSWGIYGEANFQYGQLNDEFTYINGGSLMFIMNKRFAFGGTMQRNADQNFAPTFVDNPNVAAVQYLHTGFGGLKLEYTTMPNSILHVTFPLIIGGGWANVSASRHWYPSTYYQEQAATNSFYIIQPGAQLEMNLIRCIKLYAGVNYRFSMNADVTNTLPYNTLQGFSALGGIKIGIFDMPIHRHRW